MIGIIIYVVVAFILSVILVNLSDALSSKEDEYKELLPGYNCGACGYKGCADLAHHMVDDKELHTKCRVLKGEALEKMKEYIEKN